jgi:MoxR-like ATPase
MITFLEQPKGRIQLPTPDGGLERFHEFDTRSVAAVNAALAAGRPLLVRGEPGVGKTQLAEAVAEQLQRAFLRHVVDARTESRDLLYHFDAVMRLAEAQLCGAGNVDDDLARERLEILRFVVPGPLWWAFDAQHASKHVQDHAVRTSGTPLMLGHNQQRQKNGWVVLIDEIDKAESDVPNGLLEALGSGGFTPLGFTERVEMSTPPPLIVITTNEERILPDAFVRRCVVLHQVLPEDSTELEQLLVSRGKAHFADAADNVLSQAAKILARDRQTAIERTLKPLPGQAEYLDLLRSVIRRHPDDTQRQEALLNIAANYVVRKPVDMQETQ